MGTTKVMKAECEQDLYLSFQIGEICWDLQLMCRHFRAYGPGDKCERKFCSY